MKILATAALTAAIVVLLLRSDLTPWRIVRADSLVQPPQPAPRASPRPVASAATPNTHDGAWMRDPNYRTALERTTVVGVPEPARSRELQRGASTPRP